VTSKRKSALHPIMFIGAGPAEPDLLPLRALNALKEADLVIADEYLEDFAQHLAPQAEIISTTIDEDLPMSGDLKIKFAIDPAKEGKAVVRLCADDPMLTDALSKEISALNKAKIEFEYIPGLSSVTATPAHAGVSLFSGKSKEIRILDALHPIDWSEHLDPKVTLIILNATDKAGQIANNLVARGRDGETPMVVTREGSTVEQRSVVSTLDRMSADAKAARQSGPGLVIIGDPVSNRAKYSWFESKPLFGWKVLVPRTKDDGGKAAKLLTRYGAVTIDVPTISVEPPRTPQQMERAVNGLVSGRYQWVAFTSTNAVRAVKEKLAEYGLDARAFSGIKVAAIGDKTVESLIEFGVQPDLVPDKSDSSDDLLEVWPTYDQVFDPINRVFLPRADIAVESLAEGMIKKGWEVEDITAFRTVRAAPPAAEIREAIKTGGFDAVLFSSASTVRNLVGIAGKPHPTTVIAVIGPATAQAAEEHGLVVSVQAEEPNMTVLIESLAAYGEKLKEAALEKGETSWRPSKRRNALRRRY
jgi:uroporphyrinogen III methyltransferase/synthase